MTIFKRYDLATAWELPSMVENPIGDWVKSEDYFKLFRERNRLLEEVKDLEKELRNSARESNNRYEEERHRDIW